MPAFQPITSAGLKRKSSGDDSSSSRKRLASESLPTGSSAAAENYWMVQWCAMEYVGYYSSDGAIRRYPQGKKHKTWDGDAVLVVAAGTTTGTLYDMEGKR